MFVTSMLLLAVLLPINCFGPGFFFVRRLSWSPGEKVCASVGLSCLLLYLAATGIYLLGLNPAWHYAVSALALGLGLAALPDLRALCRQPQARALFAGFGLLLLWGLLLLAQVRHYSGDGWSGDWQEHYERSLFFLHQGPRHVRFLDRYLLPARPPLMNLVAAHFLAQAGEGFATYQVCFLFLNLLAALPCLLLPGLMLPGGRRQAVVLALLALTPLLLQNATFTWTKLFSAFYVLLALALYLRAWLGGDPSRLVGAAASMACAMLVHYSAVPYALFLGLHYLFRCRRRPRLWLEAAAAGAVVLALLATWFGWSVARYGARVTFASNSTVSDSGHLSPAGHLGKAAENLYYSLVPFPFHGGGQEVRDSYSQPNPLGRVRDWWFLLYQMNLPVSLGLGGAFLVPLLFGRILVGSAGSPPPRWFWLGFVAFTLVLGVAVHGTVASLGVSHIGLQPLSLLGVTFFGAGFSRLPRPVRAAVVLLCVADFYLGIYLQFRAENYFFPVLSVTHRGVVLAESEEWLNPVALGNCMSRQLKGLDFFGDHFTAAQPGLRWAMVLGLALWMWPLCRAALPGRGAARRQRRLLYGAALGTAAGFLIYCTRLEPRKAAPPQPLSQAGPCTPRGRAAAHSNDPGRIA